MVEAFMLSAARSLLGTLIGISGILLIGILTALKTGFPVNNPRFILNA